MKYNTFLDVQENLDRLGMFHMDLSLSRMQDFASAFGRNVPAVHVVGTNGKGSTSAFFESIAREHGQHTGLYTSPHFLSPRERLKVDCKMLSEAAWVQLSNTLTERYPDLGLTYFEWLTCLAALAFDEAAVDVAVMEAGLGGRYDATRVFAPRLVLLTPVGLDHEAYLGDTLTQVAEDKSHAISAGCRAITAPQHPEVMAVYERRAKAVGALLSVADPVKDSPLGLAGQYQSVNAGLARAGWHAWCELNGLQCLDAATAQGLKKAWLPGRFQVVPPAGNGVSFLLDGAHNGHGLRALQQSLKTLGRAPDALIFACMKDKNIAEMGSMLLDLTQGPIYVPELESSDRTLPAAELATALGERAQAVASLGQGLERAAADGAKMVMVCGSLYLLAEFYKLHPHLLEPSSH